MKVDRETLVRKWHFWGLMKYILISSPFRFRISMLRMKSPRNAR